MKKYLRNIMTIALLTVAAVASAETTWSYEWNKTKQNGGEGFYNFGSSYVDFDDYLTTTINGLEWHTAAVGTKKYAMTASGGQTIGSGPADAATHVDFWTDDIQGTVSEVRVNARLNKAEYTGTVSVSVGETLLGTYDLTEVATEYTFTATGQPSGRINIAIDQTSETRGTLYLKAVTIVYEEQAEQPVETANWQFEWNKSRNDEGAQGFYNFGTTYVDEPQLTTELNGLNWTYYSPETNYASYTANMGQAFGKPNAQATTVNLSTSDLAGKVTRVTVRSRVAKVEQEGKLAVSVAGVAYLADGAESVSLTNEYTDYTFTTTDAQEGLILIQLQQNPAAAGTLYIKSISIDYITEQTGITAPTFTPEAAAHYDEPQQVSLSVSGYADGYTIWYTTDGTSPRLADGSRLVYSGPITIAETTTVKAVTEVDGQYSEVVEQTYRIRREATWYLEFPESVKDKTYVIEYPDNAVGPWLVNPDNIDVLYSSGDESVVYVDNYGDLWSTGLGQTRIWVYSSGNDEFKFKLEEYYVNVVEKEPLKTPVVTPMGGTFQAPVDVTVTTDDPRAYTIWWSTTARDLDELTDDPTIIPSTTGTISITKSCRLLLVTAGYNVFSPLVELEFIIDDTTGISEVNASRSGSPVYSVGGQRVGTPRQKGVYIQQGKKIIMR